MILVERIERLMGERKIKSWRELARRTRISPSYIGDTKSHRTQPSLTTLYALAASLGTSVGYLIGETDLPHPAGEETASHRSRAAGDLEKLVKSLCSEEPDIGILLRMANEKLPEMDKKDRHFLAATVMFALTLVTGDAADL